MSNLFNSFLEASKSAIQIWATNTDPHQVRTVSPSTYTSAPIKLRGESVMVYGPLMNRKSSNGDNSRYDVVVQTSNSCFCVFWSSDWSEAERYFQMYDPIISHLFRIDGSLSTAGFLTTLCQTIKQDPSQNLAHIVIKLDLKQIMNESVVLRDMNGLNYLGQSPFHLAIMTQNIHAINYLIGKKVIKDNVDIDRNNIYHFAAVTSKEIIETLAEDPKTKHLLNNCNIEGHTPLHIACLKDKPECLKALLCSGADVNVTGRVVKSERGSLSSQQSDGGKGIKEIIENYPKQLQTKDIKNGGTPLHWATSSEIIEALSDSGCIIDAKNFKGKTALHIMVQKKRLDCALALIVRNASINMPDDEFGNSPLHDAVDIGHVQLIKALLVFNADPLAQNKEGLTPWGLALKKCQNASMVESLSRTRIAVLYSLHAVGASQNFSSIPDVERKTYETEFAKLETTSTCKNLRPRTHFDAFLNSAAASGVSSDEFSSKGRLLSLDGGGIKGLVLTTILKYMENRYQTPILHCFDWIAGTSTGGILALALLSGKSVDECQMLYYRLKDKVFGGEASRPYNSAPFDKLLQQEFGNDTVMQHLPPNPKVMVTATFADRCPPDLMLFRNYKSPQDKINIPDYDNPELGSKCSSNERLIWKAARASGAAPSFFRPEECYVDGGILSNNPSIDLLTEITEHNVVCRFLKKETEVCTPKVLVSLGTGLPPVKRTKVVDIFRPNNATETFKLFLGWDGMGKLMLDSILDTDGRVVDRTRSWCLGSGIKYHRISPPLLEDVELDATDDKILVELMWTVLAFCVSKDEDIMGVAPYLVEGFVPQSPFVKTT